MKIIQFQIQDGFFQTLTYWALCEDGTLWWSQPTNGAPIKWHMVQPPPTLEEHCK